MFAFNQPDVKDVGFWIITDFHPFSLQAESFPVYQLQPVVSPLAILFIIIIIVFIGHYPLIALYCQ